MNNAAALTYQTVGLYAGVYKETNPKSMLTHTRLIGAERALCKRVQADSLIEECDASNHYTAEELAAVPTCPVCAARLAKLLGA